MKVTNAQLDLVPEVEWARLTAFIDAEGCVRIVKGAARPSKNRVDSHGAWHGVVLHVSNTDPRLMVWLQRNFGGVVMHQKHASAVKRMYDWRAYNGNVCEILKRCLPYFIMKRDQAELAIAFRATMTGTTKKLAPEVVAQREEMFHKMKVLKRIELPLDTAVQ